MAIGRRRARSLSNIRTASTFSLGGSTATLATSLGPTKVNTSPGSPEPDGQGVIVQMLMKLQRRKEKYDRRTMWGIFGFGIIAIIAGLSVMIVEVTTKLKYPRASAAMLSIEIVGIAVGVCATLQGIVAIVSWRMSYYGHKQCLVGFLKSCCTVILIGAFVAFCLDLIGFGIYTTLRDWQRKASPFLSFQSNVMKKFGKEDWGINQGVLEELVVLKCSAFSFHLIVLIATAFLSLLCLLNGYVSSMPDFGGCADALTAAGRMLTLKRPSKSLL